MFKRVAQAYKAVGISKLAFLMCMKLKVRQASHKNYKNCSADAGKVLGDSLLRSQYDVSGEDGLAKDWWPDDPDASNPKQNVSGRCSQCRGLLA